jgi:hypothetical protein
VALRLWQLKIFVSNSFSRMWDYEYRNPLRDPVKDISPEGSNNFHSQPQSFP